MWVSSKELEVFCYIQRPERDFLHYKGHLAMTHFFMNIGCVVPILNILCQASAKGVRKELQQGAKTRRIWSPAVRIKTRKR